MTLLINLTKNMTESERIAVQNSNYQHLENANNSFKNKILDYITYTISARNTVCITGCDKSITERYAIPDTIEGFPVLDIGQDAFKDCVNLTTIVIPQGVLGIYGGAFQGCTNLEHIAIPNSITYIAANAFQGCTKLTSVALPPNLSAIGEGAFEGCTNLQYITIPDRCKSIGQRAFRDCTSLKNITLPKNLTVLNIGLFERDTALESIVIPDGVTKISGEVFNKCYGLKSITVPASLTNIGFGAFSECKVLAHVYHKGSEHHWGIISKAGANERIDPSKFSVIIHHNQELATQQYVDLAISELENYVNNLIISLGGYV